MKTETMLLFRRKLKRDFILTQPQTLIFKFIQSLVWASIKLGLSVRLKRFSLFKIGPTYV